MNKKICLLTFSLSSGGAEKMAANMSISLSRKGCDVFIVCMEDEITYSYSGTLFNFGKIKRENNKLKAFIKFRQFFKKENFDVIIDHRVRDNFFKEYILSKLIFVPFRVIYVVHHYKLSLYFPKVAYPILTKLVLVKNSKVVAVSKSIKQKITKDLNIESQVIYNYTITDNNDELDVDVPVDYIIGVGRLVKVKQFDVLIKSYKKSNLPLNNIKLLILGDGEEKERLFELIKKLNLSNHVKLLGFKDDAHIYIKKSKAIVMSSESEGFPMVLIEALKLKTPIISFNCKSGPSEIIKHDENGFLVKNQDSKALSNAMNKLVLDKKKYSKIKGNIDSTINPFSEETIINQWLELF